MAIEINFDIANIPENPTLILANRQGDKIGILDARNIVIKDAMVNPAEITFTVYKYIDNKLYDLWDEVKDYKLVYCQEADLWFQIKVDIDELSNSIKNVSCVQLAQAELSQIMLYNIEINTEDDIARDDYVEPTVLYNNNNHSISLLHRITEKARHYEIFYVSPTIASIQRTFSFDDISIYDACLKIAEEIDCLFVFHSDADSNGNIRRGISVYDLESYCTNCGNRGVFSNNCPKCGCTDILDGYGEDTTIFITVDELGKDIKLTSDTDSQKNCFKLEAGDDLMTATVRNCNPNGSDYIWYIPNYIKEDMSEELVDKINQYDVLYEYYQNQYSISIDQNMLNSYNQLINKYSQYRSDLTTITSPIIGYSNLMIAYYQTIDLAMYLQSELLPTIEIAETNAVKELRKLTVANISPVSVTNITNISLATANNAVLSVAKCLVNPNFQVKINSSSLSGAQWSGSFYVENYSDETDNATGNSITIQIDSDYTNYVNQKIKKVLAQDQYGDMDVEGLFKKEFLDFKDELKKYNLDSLSSLQSICQSCIDVLIEQGATKDESWNGTNLYQAVYLKYYRRLKAIEYEQNIRQNELYIINGEYTNDKLTENGLQTLLNKNRNIIHNQLNFQNYLGQELWNEFSAYRRESKYSNDNYISDGLSNSEIFEKALEFIEVAKKELYKSAELQHSISSTLTNLLVIPKFKPLVNYFKVGNWIRIQIDDDIYKLRLLNYSIDYSNLEEISVEFSDVLKTCDGYSDQQSLIKEMTTMTTSYDSVQRQASQGSQSKQIISNWTDKGLNVTNNKIINGSFNQTQTWDDHGMLFRQYNDENDDYEDCQLKIVNSTLAVTDDNWNTVKTAVGKYFYINPTNNQVEYGFGVNAETVVGKLILGEQLGIYNSSGSLTFDQNGFVISNSKNTFTVNPNSNNLLTISKTINNTTENIFYVDTNGVLHLKGDGADLDLSNNGTMRIGWNNISQYIQLEEENNKAILSIYDELGDYALMKLTSTGVKYYKDNTVLGAIGTGRWGNNNMYGIVFRLNYVESDSPTEGRYMSWGYEENAGEGYVVKLAYLANTYDNNTKGFHFYDTVYFENPAYIQNRLYINDNVYLTKYANGDAGIRSLTNQVSIVGQEARMVSIDSLGNELHSFKVSSTGIDCYGDIDMHHNSIVNSSDVRLKNNINDTNVNALDLLNKICLKSFDWIDTKQHEEIGVIAQQLQEIIPDIVTEDLNTSKLSVMPLKFIPYLIKAIQELSQIINITPKTQNTSNDRETKKYTINEKNEFIKKLKQSSNLKEQISDTPKIVIRS